MASDGYRNFRLRGIPDSFQNRREVRELVRTTLQLDESAEIAVHSLARSPLERCSRIATLTFQNNVPKVLEGSQTEWIFTVPGSDEDEDEKWGLQRLVFDTHFRGFIPLHRADDSECSTDLIAISGLAGHAFGSFKARGSSFMWLRDDLPVRLRQTRILVYGYDTKVVASSSFQNLNDLGNMFRYSVKRLQLGSSACYQIRPTIFLGHSLGGLVIKEAIMKMKGSKKAEDKEFLENIIAFMFFGVPHQGMATEHLFPMVGEQPNRSLIQSLGKHSAILQRYEEEFSEALETREPKPEILSFYETEMSPTAKFNEGRQIWESSGSRLAVLVDRSSATNGCTSGCAIARNHSEMVKFTSELDEMYDIVLASLLPLLDGKSITSKSLSKDERDCLESLFFNEQNFRQAEIHDAENTCAWLLDDPQYRNWIRQPRGLLWIKGKPGAGKSVLIKYAAEKLREKTSGPRELVASFYIHGRGIDLQKKVIGVYRALLHDLIPHFDDALSQCTLSFNERKERYGSYSEGKWQWSERDLENLLLQVLTHASTTRRIVIFIDALDECEKDTPIKLLTCLKRFGEKIEQHNSYAKICFSSRHYPILGQAGIPTIVVEDRNHDDIRQVVEEKFEDIESDEELHRIAQAILSKENGVFQWAVLVADKAVKKYLKGYGARSIKREIETLPEELDNLYAGLLEEVNEDEDEKIQVLKLFRWVLFARRPLSVEELREALATDPHISYATIAELREHGDYAEPAERFERRVIDMSKGLIQFNTRGGYKDFGREDAFRQAEFIHQSVPDYLLEFFLKPAEAVDATPYSSVGCGNFELSRSCLRYLTMNEICAASMLPTPDIVARYPLLKYAIRHLFSHIQRAEAENVDQSDLARFFHWDDETKRSMLRLAMAFDRDIRYIPEDWPFRNGNMFHLLAALGSISAMRAMLRQDDIEIDCKDLSKNTPLLIALREGHFDIARELLDRSVKWLDQQSKTGAEIPGVSDVISLPASAKSYFVDVNAENDESDTPLSLAISRGATDFVYALIDAGASLKSCTPAGSPLLYSIRTNDKQLLMKTIKDKVNLDGALYYVMTRMTSANYEHTEELIRLLLDAGATSQTTKSLVRYTSRQQRWDGRDKDAIDNSSGSALGIAVRMNHLPIAKLLLAHGSISLGEMRDALQHTVAQNNLPMAEVFLTHGLYFPEELSDALTLAAKKDSLPMAELFLTHRSYSSGELGDSLKLSAEKDSLHMAELFLTYGSYSAGELGDSLQLAVKNDSLPMAELFLIRNPSRNHLEPEITHDLLRTVVESGNESMAEMLLNNTAEINLGLDLEAYETIVAAIMSGHQSMAELLLNYSAVASSVVNRPSIWARVIGRMI